MEEIWKDIEGYEGLYQVSNLGRVKSLQRQGVIREKILKNSFDNKDYVRVSLFKSFKVKTAKVHRLVAEAFIPNIDAKTQVNHINGIKHDNCINNLEWNTASENNKHALDSGLRRRDALCVAVIDKNTGHIYKSIKEAGFAYSISSSALSMMLRGERPNKTNLQKL